MRCPDCQSTAKLKKTSHSANDSVCHREYYCRSCGVSLKTDETLTHIKRPIEGPVHAPARNHPKHVVRQKVERYIPERELLPEPVNYPTYKGQ